MTIPLSPEKLAKILELIKNPEPVFIFAKPRPRTYSVAGEILDHHHPEGRWFFVGHDTFFYLMEINDRNYIGDGFHGYSTGVDSIEADDNWEEFGDCEPDTPCRGCYNAWEIVPAIRKILTGDD